MNKQTLVGIFIVIAIVTAFVLMRSVEEAPDPVNSDDEATNDIEAGEEDDSVVSELEKLSYEATISGKTIIFDYSSVEPTAQEEYVALPYAVNAQLVETPFSMDSDETPTEFVERFLEHELPSEAELSTYTEDMYKTNVSLYEMSAENLAEFPAGEGVSETPEPTGGISAYVQIMNLPDDSVGGVEHRLDFIAAGNSWALTFHGERSYCRRPGQEFWQPANQLCP